MARKSVVRLRGHLGVVGASYRGWAEAPDPKFLPDTHRNIFKREATDCDGLYDFSSCDNPSSICDGNSLVREVGRITLVVVVATPSAGIPCRKR